MITYTGPTSAAELADDLTAVGSVYVELPCGDGTQVGLWVGDSSSTEEISPTRARELVRIAVKQAIAGVDDDDDTTHLGMLPAEMRRRLIAAKSCLQ